MIRSAVLLLAAASFACSSTPRGAPYSARAARKDKEYPIGEVLFSFDQTIRTWSRIKLEWPTASNLSRLHGLEVVLLTDARANFDRLLEQLETGVPRNRAIAASALGFSKDPRAVEALLRATRDPVGGVASNAYIGLAVLATAGPPAIHPPLDPLLEAVSGPGDPERRTNAALAVKRAIEAGARSPQATSALRGLLRDEVPGVRAQAAASLGDLGAEETVEDLRSAAEDTDPVVRAAVAYALGRIGGREGRDTLERLAAAPEPGVRQVAREALARLEGVAPPAR